jgi:23S rRNA (uridine2552-2'-O)-methyltransferase
VDPRFRSLGLAAFFDADLGLRFGPFDVAARSKALVAKHAQGFDFGALTSAFAVFQYLEVAWTRHAVLVYHALFFGFGPPQHQQLANVLDGRSAEFVRQGFEHFFACRAVIRKHPHLDKAVRVQSSIDFFFNVGREAIAPYQHHRVQVVCECAVLFALGGSQLYLGHTGIIPVMKTKKSSTKVNKAWLHDHINDPYVKLANREGYRARAAYKLKEIDETLHLIKPGQLVVDLGCAPGAWSQYVRRRMSPQGAAVGDLDGTIIGLDLLPMEPIEGVTFIQGDFREAEVLTQLEAAMTGRQADVVVSDMAPNLSGISSADAARVELLIELAIEFAQNHMKPQGALVAKVFHGPSYNAVVQRFKDAFTVVKPVKPKASRDRSSETFLVGLGLR